MSSNTCNTTGQWTSSVQPTCPPSPCPPLSNPINGQVLPATGNYGDTVTFSCIPGYSLVGQPYYQCSLDPTNTFVRSGYLLLVFLLVYLIVLMLIVGSMVLVLSMVHALVSMGTQDNSVPYLLLLTIGISPLGPLVV